ncbi:hypothetical protein BTW15_21330 [Pseudomonas syringae pv. tomato]|uniref:Uncharacterized protein n=1 Tax=Pseudomonas syringae pv. tomato TaxID=323 RepID=A0AB36KQ99_PSEUB|nr:MULTISPECIES: hypothetical protein [Pseudomonas syringae group]MBI6845954.1 hypothetical protein [Pseudomonas syringae]MBX6509167.1 hypothetical protein [Pseudomonas syringae pv. tomato]OPE58008.1 hypothetical protein BTW15_21330 [Pseudomonas syringae pv. tomato]TES57674.1 hypothetical protein E2N91_16000 [Pseudomonas syringae pv. tomato]TES80415.1 hypothetical protein E2N89_04620 [Pseudomonas syringae pv. tomato]
MQTIWDLMTNAHMEAWIWGPLMGAIVGMAFAGFNAPPNEKAPVTVIQTTRVFVTTNIVIHNKQHPGTNGESGAGAIFLFSFIVMLFFIWKYVVYVEYIRYAFTVLITSVLAFSLTAALLSILKGQLNSSSWILYIFAPMTALVANYFLLTLATRSLDPKLPPLAAATTPLDFYINQLSEYGRILIFFQMFGMVLVLITTVCMAFVLIHYLALMNQRSTSIVQPLWTWLTRATFLFSGRGWLVLTTVFIILAYIFIEPSYMPAWTTALGN